MSWYRKWSGVDSVEEMPLCCVFFVPASGFRTPCCVLSLNQTCSVLLIPIRNKNYCAAGECREVPSACLFLVWECVCEQIPVDAHHSLPKRVSHPHACSLSPSLSVQSVWGTKRQNWGSKVVEHCHFFLLAWGKERAARLKSWMWICAACKAYECSCFIV